MKLLNKIKENLFLGFLHITLVWIIFAISFQIFMITTEYTNPNLSRTIGNKLSWKFDGSFKNLPENVWYEKSKTN
jgi:hypothetical protein